MTTVRLPLFPLNTVLFPGLVLPLNVFEERYRAMMREFRLSALTNFWLVVAILVAATAAILLLVGLLSGQGGP